VGWYGLQAPRFPLITGAPVPKAPAAGPGAPRRAAALMIAVSVVVWGMLTVAAAFGFLRPSAGNLIR